MSLIERSFQEKIVVVGVFSDSESIEPLLNDLIELEELIKTAGAIVVDKVVQKREIIDPKTYIGSGKAEELKTICYALDVDTVVFDNELTPVQQRNLESILGRTAIDRTAVILDIFAQNAKTEQGKTQVELAMLNYRLPRLRGRGITLSQQGGGIGTRGPGETQLEVDRRQLLTTKSQLEKRLKQLKVVSSTQKRHRVRSMLFRASLVGYTNAGKTTLLNTLVRGNEYVADQLFATLDTKIRQLWLTENSRILVSDTVGFIRKLPHHLVEAFKSTLTEIEDSNLLLHVIDGSAEDPIRQIDAVNTVLGELNLLHIPQLLIFNKCDLNMVQCKRLMGKFQNSVMIDAKSGLNVDLLKQMIYENYISSLRYEFLIVPNFRQDVISLLSARTLGSIELESSSKFDLKFNSEAFEKEMKKNRDQVVSSNGVAALDNTDNELQSIYNRAITSAEVLVKEISNMRIPFPATFLIAKVSLSELQQFKQYIVRLPNSE
jgi:GTP-binding protein HflX